MIDDTYKTIEQPSKEILYKDKNSKFFGYAFPVTSDDEVKKIIDQLKKDHHAARHWCYAWQIGIENPSYRVNDDGEPSNSAGQPIYGQILSFEVTNILIVVVRYFGGIKLGVGGLISAYKSTAQMSLEASSIVRKTINHYCMLIFDYKNMNKVMRVIKARQLDIIEQNLGLDCRLTLSIRKNKLQEIIQIFEGLYEVQVKML
ncbi:IMPACT family protein [Aquimarina sp. W85]|uniref:IMPACT family protein n=1 Tax=Aquimarina rhodophyticola TaxID=3342246 RepID=UPI00366EB12D